MLSGNRLGPSGTVWGRLGLSGAVWSYLGRLGPSGAVLGLCEAVWGRLGTSGTVWEAVWGCLEDPAEPSPRATSKNHRFLRGFPTSQGSPP